MVKVHGVSTPATAVRPPRIQIHGEIQRIATINSLMHSISICVSLASILLVACGSDDRGPDVFPTGGNVGAGGSTLTGIIGGTAGNGSISPIIVDGGPGGSGNDNGDAARIIGTLPPDFTKAESGGYKLGQPIMGAGVMDTGLTNGVCNEIAGVVRDFKGYNVPGGQPDFEHFAGNGTVGLVEATLGADLKPLYTGLCEAANPPKASCPDGQMTTGKANFDEWYRFTESVNKPYVVYFFFQATPGQSVITFNSQYFFPLDGAGWQAPGVMNGDSPLKGNDKMLHNFSFTTEVHTKFKYLGGETFTFEGDDDLWVFMNQKLAIDLGGLHPALSKTVDVDAEAASLGLVRGNTYPLDLFHAERHTTASHFRIDTTLSLVDCGRIPPDVPR